MFEAKDILQVTTAHAFLLVGSADGFEIHNLELHIEVFPTSAWQLCLTDHWTHSKRYPLSSTVALGGFFILKAVAAAAAATILIDRTGGMHSCNGVSPWNA